MKAIRRNRLRLRSYRYTPQRRAQILRGRRNPNHITSVLNALDKMLSGLPLIHVRSVHRLINDVNNKDFLDMIAQGRNIRDLIVKGLIFVEASHRIRNLLYAIVGHSECLLHDPESLLKKESIKGFTERFSKNALALASILSMIEKGSSGSLEKSETFLDQALQEVIKDLETAFPDPDRTILFECEETGIRINLNKLRFGFALFNVVLNSFEHGASQTTIKVKRLDVSKVQIKIIDNGGGFDKSIKDQITNEGFTTKDEEEHGYGITIAKKITEEHGGSFDIDSDGRGKGCTVTINLPIIST